MEVWMEEEIKLGHENGGEQWKRFFNTGQARGAEHS
jgi:hypothetical protein